jgi:hypothetical protein
MSCPDPRRIITPTRSRVAQGFAALICAPGLESISMANGLLK